MKLAETQEVDEDAIEQFEEEDLENIRQAAGIMSREPVSNELGDE